MQLKNLKKIKRFRDIAAILIKYGFDEIVQRMEIPGVDFIRKIRPEEKEMGIYERIRRTIEDLGPTFVKFGQIMSLRPDMLPSELLEELEKLQDDVPALELADMEQTIEKSLGKPIKDVFSVFDVEPMAAASLSQVHKGVLKHEGHIVSVKIQRPDIIKKIESDLDILETICIFLDQKFDDLKTYDLPKLVDIIRSNLMKEVDFTIELRNMKIARSYASGSEIYIPKAYDQYCSEKLLVMELVQGTKFKNIVPGSNYDTERIAKQGLNAAIKQILEDGFFHADPHPGNLLVTEDMNLCIIDWGIIGRLTEKDRFELIEFLKAVVDKDSNALVHSLLRLCQTTGKKFDPRAMERELLDILDTYYAVPIKDMDIGQLLMSITTLIRNHKLRLPADLVIMIKALVTAEGSARQAYPELDVVSEIREYVSRLAMKRFKPETVWRNLRNSILSVWTSQREIPRQIQQIISKLDRGEMAFHFRLEKLEQLANSLENASNRLVTGIIIGAIIMGSSMIITTGIGPYLFGFPALGVIGYLLSVVLGLWLIVTILRTKKY
jgi:ubiquinone biosynthesis protein